MKTKNSKGFTLIELIVVIVIIGILAAIAVPKFMDLSDSAKLAACQQNQASLESAATIYYANAATTATAAYPTSIALLVPDFIPTTPGCPTDGLPYGLSATTGWANCGGGSSATHNIH